jgi:MHS family alpha-ketoglutarate permease-like MFS transporter
MRSILGGCFGSVIEWFDFLGYSIFAVYFAKSFFPTGSQTAQLLNVVAIAAIGYIARPLGSWFLGCYADRNGRQSALVLSVGFMACGSFMIAFTPTCATIGIWAPILLGAARLMQGLSMGGEYGTSATYLTEIVPGHRRGFYLGFLQVSVGCGQVAALALLLLLQHLVLRPGQMEAWGWRIPFAVGGVLALYALYLRLRIDETEDFKASKAKGQNQGALSGLLTHWKAMLLAVGMTMGGTISFYTYTVYMQKFMVNTVGMSREAASLTAAGALLCYLPLQPLFGFISDLVGRRPVMIFFGVGGTLLTVPLLTAMSHASSALEAFALNLAALVILSGFTSIHMLVRSELFPANVRALAVGLSYAFTTAVLGGTTEWVALKCKAIGREEWFFWYVSGAVLISLVVYLFMPETRHTQAVQGTPGHPAASETT